MTAAIHEVGSAWRDIVNAVLRWRVWTAFAWEDVQATYKRSIFGIAWIAASFALFVIVKILIFRPLLRDVAAPEYFTAYLIVGFFCFQYISQAVSSATSVFTSAESWLRNDPLPLSLFAFKAVFRSLFDLILTGAVTAAVLVYLGIGGSFWSFMAIPAILAYIVNGLWVKIILGIICTRFRDIAHFVQAILRVMFFISPVIWMPEQIGPKLMEYLWWNPFAHFIWIFRTPILDGDPALDSWVFVGVVTLVGWLVTLGVFAAYRRRIVYWL